MTPTGDRPGASLTIGIDLASQDVDTAICRIAWTEGTATVVDATASGADDGAVLAAVLDPAARVGVDCPFGWPTRFVRSVRAHDDDRPWPDRDALGADSRKQLRYRVTDLAVNEACQLMPRSVSTELIGVVALRWAGLLDAAHVESGSPVDRTGAGHLLEVYPAAALKRWGLPHRGYKNGSDEEKCRDRRSDILDGLRDGMDGRLEISESTADLCRDDDDVLDALVCALIARAAAVGAIDPLPEQHRDAAVREGWIVLPKRGALGRLVDDPAP